MPLFVWSGPVQPLVRYLVIQKAGMDMYCSYYPLPHSPIPPHPAVDPVDII